MKTIHQTVGLLLQILQPPPRDERGLSQSTELAILLAGAAAVAIALVAFITSYVQGHLPK
ncbi:MAG: hypothetical protein QM713_09875 [Arachnia sp.]